MQRQENNNGLVKLKGCTIPTPTPPHQLRGKVKLASRTAHSSIHLHSVIVRVSIERNEYYRHDDHQAEWKMKPYMERKMSGAAAV